MYELRPYQRECVDVSIKQLKSSLDPFIIEAATGSGKSVIIAEIARYINQMTGKRILCTAPTSDLVLQNREKYVALGNPASVFSSSAGEKSLRHPVVFGTPLTVKNRISAFKRDFAMILVDECDAITPSIKDIIEEMREGNPNLRIMGLTATPYRLGSGFIFREWPDGKINGEDVAREPYFSKCVYRIAAHSLIERGFLTPPMVGEISAERYDTSKLQLNSMGKFDSAEVDRAFVGQGRKSAAVVGDIVERSKDRRGVLIFAVTVRHAEEIMASLPPSMSEIITGTTKDRGKILDRFRRQEIKYLVNVNCLTIGVDMPHVDHIAILRATESARLYQQIIGRGLRLFPDKADCLVSDYTDNIDRQFPDGDIFNPEITAKPEATGGDGIEIECPECGYHQQAKLNKDYLDYQYDTNGYALDVFGEPIQTDYGPLPVHHTRRCWGMVSTLDGKDFERCGYFWTSKTCSACDAKSDIAARYCSGCSAELIDPGDKIIMDFKALKRSPHLPQTDEILSFESKKSISQRGNETIRIDITTPFRSFSSWLLTNPKTSRQMKELALFQDATRDGKKPTTVSYMKNTETGFYTLLNFNAEPDPIPDGYEMKKTKEEV